MCEEDKPTGVLHGEVRLALHVGRQLVHAQRHLPFEGRRLLAEDREAPEGALPGEGLGGGVSAGDHLGAQRGHGEGGGGRRGGGASTRLTRGVIHRDGRVVVAHHTNIRLCWKKTKV